MIGAAPLNWSSAEFLTTCLDFAKFNLEKE